jgi:hypothetical protein
MTHGHDHEVSRRIVGAVMMKYLAARAASSA